MNIEASPDTGEATGEKRNLHKQLMLKTSKNEEKKLNNTHNLHLVFLLIKKIPQKKI